jgi:hypothetical protein
MSSGLPPARSCQLLATNACFRFLYAVRQLEGHLMSDLNMFAVIGGRDR